jgi:hypothetical protein
VSGNCPLCLWPRYRCACPNTGHSRSIALTEQARSELQRERDQKARTLAMHALFGPWPTCAEVVTSH